ncbi:MAG: hypothetical protein ABWZ26_07895 [Candidatus Nanopelagicales bacterium]
MNHRLSRALAMSACSFAFVVTTGCAAGFDAPTEEEYAPGDGVIGQVGDLKLRNVLLVTDVDDENAAVIGVVVNDGLEDDRLVGLAVDGEQVRAELPAEVEAGQTLSIGPVDADLVATAARIDFEAGDFVEVEFEFDSAGTITLQALALAPRGIYEDYAPEAPATPFSP